MIIFMVKHIFLLFFGRTGSTYSMQVFKCCKDSKVLCAYGEIFTTVDAIMRTFKAGQELGIQEAQYKNWAKKNPYEYIKFIDSVHKESDCKYLISKIQIPFLVSKDDETIKKILNFKNSVYIIVRRNILDSYISSQKAKVVGKMSRVDTTKTKIKVNFNDLMYYYKKINSSFARIINMLPSNRTVFLKYEDIHSKNSNKDKAECILKKMQTVGLKLELDETKFKNEKFLFRQDRSNKVCDKVSNFHDLKKFLVRNRLDYLLRA